MSSQTSLLRLFSVSPSAILSSRRLTSASQFSIHRLGVSVRFKSTLPKRNDFPKLLNSSKPDHSAKTSKNSSRSVDSRTSSEKAFDCFIADLKKSNELKANKELDYMCEELKEWATGESFPVETLESAQTFFARHDEVIAGLTPEQKRMLCTGMEITRRDAWHKVLRAAGFRSKSKKVKRSPFLSRRSRGRRYHSELEKIRRVISEARTNKNAVRLEIEHVAGTQASYMLSVRVSNAIKLLVFFNRDPYYGWFVTLSLAPNKGEGGKLARRARHALAKVDPVVPNEDASREKVFSQLLQCIKLVCPSLKLWAKRLPAHNGKSGVATDGLGKRGYRLSLTLKNNRLDGKDGCNDKHKKETGTDKESQISQAASHLFEDFLGAKLELEIINSPNAKK